jgi:DNA-binding protein H-NS
MATLQELIQQRDALNVQIAEMQQAQRAEALAEIRARMREYQISVEDLASSGRSAQLDKPKSAPKYRNPETGKTWSGRGKRPQWIHDALADGQSLDKYLI